MSRVSRVILFALAFHALAGVVTFAEDQTSRPAARESILLIVTDPLSRELACACVKGFGQRDYRKLASWLQLKLQEPVSIEYSDDLAESMAGVSPGREVIVIGDRSLVRHDVQRTGRKYEPICDLTDQEGETNLQALFIVRSDDSANQLSDLRGRKIFFGLPEADEKFPAALESLRSAGISIKKPDKRGSYSDVALDLLDSDDSPPPVAAVPGYALRLLNACGSVKPGSFRVIGKTPAAPFITAFLSDTFAPQKKKAVQDGLLAVNGDPRMLQVLESKAGFRTLSATGDKPTAANVDWPDWRGVHRDGRLAQLPKQLPASPKIVWRRGAAEGALAGVAVSKGRVISAERDLADEFDVYRCFDADTGELRWRAAFPARGTLDYGKAPRATPVIHENTAYLLGAFGDLHSVSLEDGGVIWTRQLVTDFKASLPTWGMCSPPLVVDDLLIVNPGAINASIVALDLHTGQTRWTTPGARPAYGAFVAATFAGQHQIVGYDRASAGGWDVQTGKRLWELIPPVEGDFNVPTPIVLPGALILSTENNGTRLYRFGSDGRILCQPAAGFPELAPTTTSAVVTRGKLFGAHNGLHCLDVENGLKPLWHQDVELSDHATLLADGERVLVISSTGELILLDAAANKCSIISRLRLFDDDVEVYSHPALVGSRLYARGASSLVCAELNPDFQ